MPIHPLPGALRGERIGAEGQLFQIPNRARYAVGFAGQQTLAPTMQSGFVRLDFHMRPVGDGAGKTVGFERGKFHEGMARCGAVNTA